MNGKHSTRVNQMGKLVPLQPDEDHRLRLTHLQFLELSHPNFRFLTFTINTDRRFEKAMKQQLILFFFFWGAEYISVLNSTMYDSPTFINDVVRYMFLPSPWRLLSTTTGNFKVFAS
jgi:hypothetical protein